MQQLLVDRPGWLDWSWALTVLDQEVRLAGEEVRPAEGVIATPLLLSDKPLVVTVTAGGSHLVVMPSEPALARRARSRRVRRDTTRSRCDPCPLTRPSRGWRNYRTSG